MICNGDGKMDLLPYWVINMAIHKLAHAFFGVQTLQFFFPLILFLYNLNLFQMLESKARDLSEAYVQRIRSRPEVYEEIRKALQAARAAGEKTH